MYQKSVLNNGLRIVTEEMDHFHSVALGVWLNAGSRDKTVHEHGLTHFLEHMAFKGTPRRTALDIAREIDRVGGVTNAFTTKEQTCFHGKVLAEHLPRLVDLISDMVLNSFFQAEDLKREREVILEEIYAQDDSPEDLVQVYFARSFWGDNPFGWPILGEAEQILKVTRDDLLNYRRATYPSGRDGGGGRRPDQPPGTGGFGGRPFQDFANGRAPGAPPGSHPSRGLSALPGSEQVNLCLGTRGVAAGEERRYAATLLQLILGGNMSSRLFQVIREQLGLAYTIYSFLSFYSDTGILGISAGVSPKNLDAMLAAIREELKKLKDEPVLDSELQAARERLRGSILLAAEDCEHLMMRLAKNELQFGHYIPLAEIIAGLAQGHGPGDPRAGPELLRPENWALTLLGPVDDQGKYSLA